MKKSILVLAMASLVAVACQKKEEATTQPVETAAVEEVIIRNPSITSLALSENHHNFGAIKKGETVQHTYEITNTGDNPLIISDVKPACGCTAPEFTKDPILPGQKGKIVLSFDSTNFDGLVNKQASVYANVEQSPIMLTFSAEVQP